jgi:prophage maintenance system killer protein
MPEFVSDEEIDEIIRINKKIVTARGESFGVKRDIIIDVIHSMNAVKVYLPNNNRKRIIKKTSIFLARITWEQPFNNGNKSTALYFIIQYLNKNKFDLLMDNSKIKNKIFNLLKKTVMKFENEDSIIEEVFQFLDNNVLEFKFKDW